MSDSSDVAKLQAIAQQSADINVAINTAIQAGCPAVQNNAEQRYEISTEAFRKVSAALKETPGMNIDTAVANVGVCPSKSTSNQR